MKKFIGIFVLLALFLSEKVHSQQVPMYGQYIFNNSVISPAQAGVSDNNQWGILGRYQWVGIEGAPTTHTAFFNFRLPANLGLAVGLYQDNIGPVKDFTFQTDVAYHAQLTEKWYLSGGLRLVTSSIKVNLLDLEHVDHNDPYFNQNLSSGLHFNVGAGLLAFSDRSFFGLAIPKAQRKGFGDKNHEVNVVSRHLFVYGGSTFDLADNLVITPSALFKTSEKAPSQLDLNAVFGYNNVVDFGPMFRSNLTEGWMDAVGFLVGIYITPNWYFGYMYEYPTNDLNLVTQQTHEVSLRYIWGSSRQIRIRSPRYFL